MWINRYIGKYMNGQINIDTDEWIDNRIDWVIARLDR